MRDHSLGKHTLFYFIANIVPSAFSFVALMIFTRWLDPHNYGLYYITYSTAILCFSLLFGGIGMAINRFCPGVDLHNNRELVGSINILLLIASLLGLLVLGVASFFVKADLLPFYFLGIMIFISQGIYQSLLDYMRSQLLSVRYALLNSIRSAVIFLISVSLLLINHSATSPLWGQCIGTFLLIFFIFFISKKKLVPLQFSFHSKKIVELMKYGAPLALGFALLYVVNNSDRWLLTWMQSLSAAGLYSAAFSFPLYCLTALMTVVNSAGYPLIVKAYNQKNVTMAKKIFSDQLTLFLIILLPVSTAFIVLQKPLVEIVLGQQYHQTAITLMPWFVGATLFAGLKSNFIDVCFQLSKRSMIQMWITLFIAIMNIILNILFIPKWGVAGAAYASFLAFFMGFLISLLFNIKHDILSINIKETIQVIMSVIIFGLICHALPTSSNHWFDLFEKLIAGGFVYLLMIYFFFRKTLRR